MRKRNRQAARCQYAGKTYYHKVRAYKTVSGKKVYGPWSVAKAFKRK